MKPTAIALLLIISLTGCMLTSLLTVRSVQQGSEVDLALLERGRDVYSEQYCGVCHQLTALDAHGAFAPSHDHVGTIATQRIRDARYGGSATTPAEYLRESLVQPGVYLAPGYEMAKPPMPSYAHLPPQDLDALVYLLTNQH